MSATDPVNFGEKAAPPVAIVTGASSGIGHACAVQLSRAGYRVVLAARTLATLAAARATLTDDRHVTRACDISDPPQARELIERTVREFGRIDVLINAAGTAPVRAVEATTPEITRSVFALNAEAPANLIHFAWPALMATGRGVIVNISSMASIDPFDGFYTYAASKAALNMLSYVANREGSPRGVHCYVLCPGAVETPMLRAIVPASVLPPSRTLATDDIATVALQCIRGERMADAGKPILLPSP